MWFVRRFGPDVNLGNIPPDEVLALETIRLGLRSDTMGVERVSREQRERSARRDASSRQTADRCPAEIPRACHGADRRQRRADLRSRACATRR